MIIGTQKGCIVTVQSDLIDFQSNLKTLLHAIKQQAAADVISLRSSLTR
jgi:hypothetical protein